ncbi:MAG: hypothetical protein ABF657_03740, partial [Lentilactobacillus diolivorans]|uniref:hypothetical protein n=1 Tax=Lentilactobacillus diolivorans TaxID=179838 RepID=UPI0039EA118A
TPVIVKIKFCPSPALCNHDFYQAGNVRQKATSCRVTELSKHSGPEYSNNPITLWKLTAFRPTLAFFNFVVSFLSGNNFLLNTCNIDVKNLLCFTMGYREDTTEK